MEHGNSKISGQVQVSSIDRQVGESHLPFSFEDAFAGDGVWKAVDARSCFLRSLLTSLFIHTCGVARMVPRFRSAE